MPYRFSLTLMLACCVTLLAAVAVEERPCRADDFQVQFTDGNVITLEVQGQEIDWTTIDPNGNRTDQKISLATIERIKLIPVSEAAGLVARLATELGSTDYFVREQAERQLSDPELAEAAENVVKSLTKDPNYEVRYRAQRILDRIKDAEKRSVPQLDRIHLTDGRVLEGKAGSFTLRANYQGTQVSIQRQNTTTITRGQRLDLPRTTALQPATAYYSPDTFYTEQQQLVDFSETPAGTEIPPSATVNDLFIPWGMRLDTEEAFGRIAVSTFKFDQYRLPPTGNSIAVFVTQDQELKRFKGITQINFCMPDNRAVAAGVHEFGLYIAQVNAARHFIMEGYDQHGDLIIEVESPDEKCNFMGFKSPVPVCKIRILSNPYLFRLARASAIDKDYALDRFCFSAPVLVPLTANEQTRLLTRGGDLLTASSLKPDGDQWTLDNPQLGTIKIATADVAQVSWPKSTSNGASPHWLALLPDGNRLKVQPGPEFTASLIQTKLNPQQVSGLQFSSLPVRVPFLEPADEQRPALVFPTCQILPERIDWTDTGFSWSESAKKLLQPVDERDLIGIDGLDPTPQETSVDFDQPNLNALPTVWLGPLPETNDNAGAIHIVDQQVLIFGDQERFQWQGISPQAIQLKSGQQDIQIPLDDVLSIRFPTGD